MAKLKQVYRLITINYVLMKHGLDEIILATHIFRPFRFLFYLSPTFWFKRDKGTRGERIRKALEDLGPIFVKFGQIISTRRDLLAPDIAEELAKLQDRVPPFEGHIARAIIEKELGEPIDAIYDRFDETPLASASIAQVHAAHLKDGSDVIVKVVRPDIEKRIKRDVALLYTLAELAEKYWEDGRRLRPVEVVEHYEKTIMDELNLSHEAANATQLRRNFVGTELLYVPEVHWDYTRRNVMTMERIYGIQISDIQGLKDAGIDFKKLSEQGVEIFFTQVFRDSFFHADMHPGNVFVRPDGRYMAIDFGIMEKAENVYTVPTDFGWSDLGTWGSVHDNTEKDYHNNAVQGEAIVYDSLNNMIKTTHPEKLVVVKGLEGYIIVDTEDALLICKKEEEQFIKQIVGDLKGDKDGKYV